MPKATSMTTFGPEQLIYSKLNKNFSQLVDAVNFIDNSQLLDEILEERHFSNDINPFIVLGELLGREAVPFGYDFLGCTLLVADIAAGRAYVLQDSDVTIPKKLIPVINDITNSVTLLANSDNYIDLTINNTFTVLSVPIGNAAPGVTADAVRLMLITTNGTTCTDNTFLADRDVFPPTIAGARPDNLYIVSDDNSTDFQTKFIIVSGNVKDSSGNYNIVVTDPIVVDVTDSGINGIETGETKDADQLYHTYLISDVAGAQTTSAILSKSELNPNLPGGFDISRKISSVYLDKDEFVMPFYQYNDRYEMLNTGHLLVGEQPTLTVVNASWRIQAFADVDISSFVPKTAKTAIVNTHMRGDGFPAGRNVFVMGGIPNYVGNPYDDSGFSTSAIFSEDPDSMLPWIHGKQLLTLGGGSTMNVQKNSIEDVPCLGDAGVPTITYGIFENNSGDPGATLHLAIKGVGYVDSFVIDDRDE